MASLNRAAQAEILALPRPLLPAAVVAWAAAHPESALHKAFEWNDTQAAAEYRILQARAFLRLVVTVTDASPFVVRALVSLGGDRGSVGYRGTAEVLGDADLRAQLVEQFLEEMRQFELRYRRVAELAKVFAALDEVRQDRHARARQRAARQGMA